MGKDKNSDKERFDERVGGGRVADKVRGTVISPNQADEIKRKSDEGRKDKKH
jgi:hypothetical protein